MVELSRRSLLEVSAAGAVGAGAAAGAAAAVVTGAVGAPGRTRALPLPNDVVVHVRDLDRAELTVLTGTGELVAHDEELVARIAALAARVAGQ
jgi:hypothetical protein